MLRFSKACLALSDLSADQQLVADYLIDHRVGDLVLLTVIFYDSIIEAHLNNGAADDLIAIGNTNNIAVVKDDSHGNPAECC